MTNLYGERDLLRLAKRYGNKKRGYLLVNPLQAKHIPADPQKALAMMSTLGKAAARFGRCRAVVGFAETATAIGAVVAKTMGDDCLYVTTTREEYADGQWLLFDEEHSHAVEQRLELTKLAALPTESIVAFVDDEISTGKTLLNLTRKLKEHCPNLKNSQLGAVSVINRQNVTQREIARAENIASFCLLRLDEGNYSDAAEKIVAAPPFDIFDDIENLPKDCAAEITFLSVRDFSATNPRRGCIIGEYFRQCENAARQIVGELAHRMATAKKIAVLGTEECMLPALLLGAQLEREFSGAGVFCHATTRSPIGVLDAADYPIKNGYALPSFYDADRKTYIYNLDAYDAAVLLTDSLCVPKTSVAALARILARHGTTELFVVTDGEANYV